MPELNKKEILLYDPKIDSLEAEYGCVEQVGFLSGSLIDSDGNVMYCKCGKPAGNAIIGREAFQVLCTECAYNPQEETKNDVNHP